jgi:type I restriction-modification system DNA methylase subunit
LIKHQSIRFVKEQFDKIPFLNGGIFNEHDGDEIPLSNDYFFTEEQTRPLPELGGKYKVAGLVRILSQYQYKLSLDDLLDREKYVETVDPEFIGKVFESLLACIDADNKETRRKITGSYYTPREIVDYMVGEALDAYLAGTPSDESAEYRTLPPGGRQPTLLRCKILDPACGSGAFPCGIMNEMMRRIDPPKEERYRTKLKILQNVIYGVDIQPMAVQISQLRLFLSLIREIVPNKKKAENYGIEPLPNLETNFVCADALIGMKKTEYAENFDIVIGNPPYRASTPPHLPLRSPMSYATTRRIPEAVAFPEYYST